MAPDWLPSGSKGGKTSLTLAATRSRKTHRPPLLLLSSSFSLSVSSGGGLLRVFLAPPLEPRGIRAAGSPLAFVGLGSLVLIPGAYASTIATGAYLGWPGFDYDMMPRTQGA